MVSNDEYVDRLLVYGGCNRNASEAQRIYQQRYPGRTLPSATTIFRFERRLRHSELFNRACGRTKAPGTSGDIEEKMLDAVLGNPHNTTRSTAQQVGISKFSVVEIMKKNTFHPYCSRGESVCFAYITSLRVEGKQMHILCKPKALPT
jgi:hypothetical protein